MKGTLSQTITAAELPTMRDHIAHSGQRFQMAYAWYPPGAMNPEVVYVASMGPQQPFALWRLKLDSQKTIPSLTQQTPLLGWYEREMHDLFGIEFSAHPEFHPLVLHAGADPILAPMQPNYPKNQLMPFTREPWHLPEMDLAGLQLLPFGPVRAGVCESAEFLYLYAGESILHFYERLFFKHRGMEQRFMGLTPALGVILSERVSGVSSVAHALAYCQAIETAGDCTIPKRAQQWRVILAELERLYNHLHYLSHLCHTTTLKVAEAAGHILTEQLKQLNALVTGSRFLRGILTPGGLRREPTIEPILTTFNTLEPAILTYVQELLATNSHTERLLNTGVLSLTVARDEGATGPIARASGIQDDFRIDHPYAAYGDHPFTIPVAKSGDADARMKIRIAEIKQSFVLIHRVLASMDSGAIFAECPVLPLAEGLGWVESPRGGLFYAVHFDASGRLQRVKIKSPSFSNWRVFPFTVDETNMMDYAINEASFGLTVAGCDR